MEQPEKLDIVWETAPVAPRKNKRWKWEVLLRPVKAAPGCEARVRTHPNRASAESEVRRIRRRLEEVDPYDKWNFTVAEMQDTSALYGVFITYLGRMTRDELNQKLIRREQHSRKIKASKAARQLREEIQGASLEELTRPNPSLR